MHKVQGGASGALHAGVRSNEEWWCRVEVAAVDKMARTAILRGASESEAVRLDWLGTMRVASES
jgi:hypothetical protein